MRKAIKFKQFYLMKQRGPQTDTFDEYIDADRQTERETEIDGFGICETSCQNL